MKTILHKAATRGAANHGWLKSFHSFSFASYYNSERMHFGALRVLNDDFVAPGMGFGKHPHENMEIVSIPLEGDLEHADSTGRQEIIKSGDVQIMSAGSGIVHSEKNASRTNPVKFLQIWVYPKKENIAPRYEQKTFTELLPNQFQTVVAPNDSNAVWINQDAWFSLANLTEGAILNYQVHQPNNGVYAFVIEGDIAIHEENLTNRDALGIWDTDNFAVKAQTNTRLLLIEVPMEF
ncbi:MAG: pirin family protein [Chitinophagaceae bacterium]